MSQTLKILGLQLRQFRLPLNSVLNIAGTNLSERRGYLFVLHSGVDAAQSVCSWGEMSPLPGVHPETFEQMAAQAERLLTGFTARVLPNTRQEMFEFLKGLLPESYCASLRFGVESAFLQAAARAQGKPLAHFLRPSGSEPLGSVAINALVPAGQEITAAVNSLSTYSSVKLKVGRGSSAQDVQRVKAVSTALRPGQTLRLDANRSWDLKTALGFARAVESCPIEYIEEPLSEPDKLAQFYAQSGMPVALDESLRETTAVNLQLFEGLAAFVIKPQSFGGWLGMQPLLRVARTSKIKAVISSVYESGLGLHILAHYAAAANPESVPAGLDTYKELGQDLVMPAFQPSGRPAAVELEELARIQLNDQFTETISLRESLC